MRQSWTDDRLDHLSDRMDERFDHVDRRFAQVDQRFEQVDRRFEQVDQRLDRVEDEVKGLRVAVEATKDSLGDKIEATNATMHQELHSLQRSMILVGGGLITANFTMTAALISLVATHL